MPGTKPAAHLGDALPPREPRRKGRSWWPGLVRGCWVGALLAVGVEGGQVFCGRNFHVVLPGRVYRCAQPSRAELEQAVRADGIRTVLNLRGSCPGMSWYTEECRATHALDVCQEDVSLSAARLPPVPEVRRLIEILDRAEYPILIHCRRGADRTGLVSAMLLLLETNAGLKTARWQLGWRFGHVAIGRTANLDWFLDLYAAWLARQGWSHSPAAFRRWVEHDYCPGACRCRVEPLDIPRLVRPGEPAALRVRVRNTSPLPWNLRPGNNAGTHAGFSLYDAQNTWLASGRAGLFEAQVEPGQTIDLTLVLPALKKPGRYRVLLDMLDEAQQCFFYQTGSEPLEKELVVGE